MRSLLFFLPYLKPHKKLFFIGIGCGLIFGASSGLGIPILFEKVFKVIFEHADLQTSPLLIVAYALLLPLVFAIRGLSGFFNAYFLNHCSMLVLKDLREALFGKLQKLQLGFFDNITSGDLINRLNSDPAAIQSVILEAASELFRQPIQMLFGLICLGYLSIRNNNTVFMLLFLLAFPVCLIPFRLLRHSLKNWSRNEFQASSEISEAVLENLASTFEIRSFNTESSQVEHFSQKLKNYLEFNLKVVRLQKMQQPMMEIIISMFIGIVFAYAFFNAIPFSVFSAMGLCLYFTLDPAKRLVNVISNLHKIQGAIERIQYILNLPLDVQNPAHPVTVKSLQGTISFSEVTFCYGKQKLFSDLSVTLPAGSKFALVGQSGGGKSTFAKLILRFYDVQKGSIAIDGIDIRNMNLHDLRNCIGVVPQQPTLLNDTIYNNILIGNSKATPAAVEAAAQAAFADTFIKDLEKGYDTIVGERGNRLSVGQKQRIALARTFLKNAPILILDEATSALDAESESCVQQALERLTQNKTVLLIAHRLSTIQKADKICVFREGAIIATGTHTELLNSCSEYASFVQKQNLH
jgi:subfamily B ATP-binding cassette protein MsbA